MALIQFECVAAGPFIMFKESAQKIFEVIGENFKEQGAFPVEDLPGILEKLENAEKADKEKAAEEAAMIEAVQRASTYDQELREKEEMQKTKQKERIRLYQRVVPLQNMIRRAIKHKEVVTWGPL